MKKFWSVTIYLQTIFLCILFGSTSALAIPVLDQESLEIGTLFDADISHWQSFTAGLSGDLYSVNIEPFTNPENNYTFNL